MVMRRKGGTGPGASPADASWVVLLTRAGAYKGMAGPFVSEEAADEWAAAVLAPERDWTWQSEPVVSPASLPRPPSRAPRRRPTLTLVR